MPGNTWLDGRRELVGVVCRLLGVLGVGAVGGVIWTRTLARDICRDQPFHPGCQQFGAQTEHAVFAVAAVATVLLVAGALADRG